jgi:hypothetical protein
VEFGGELGELNKGIVEREDSSEIGTIKDQPDDQIE